MTTLKEFKQEIKDLEYKEFTSVKEVVDYFHHSELIAIQLFDSDQITEEDWFHLKSEILETLLKNKSVMDSNIHILIRNMIEFRGE